MRSIFFSLTLLLAFQSQPTGTNFTPAPLILSGTTSSIGGGLLAAGASASGTATVTGAIVGMVCMAQPSDGTNMYALGANIGCTVTATNTVTVNVVAIITLTPASKTYVVRVVP